jgi:hypothetical protein
VSPRLEPPAVGSTGLLGGHASPVGWWSMWLEAPFEQVLTTLTTWRHRLRTPFDVVTDLGLADGVSALEPLASPWTAELIAPAGPWTLYLNNQRDGGDPTAAAPYLSRELGVRLLSAMHTPVLPSGHGGTQLWINDPVGPPPLHSVRTVSAVTEDGRWRWETSGAVQPFERPDRYLARRVQDRFDRELLLDYLRAVGIEPDDASSYGTASIVRHQVFPTTTETRAEALARLTGGAADRVAQGRHAV